MAATQFVIELNKAVRDNADMNPIYERMKELEALLEPLLSHSETWLLTSTTNSPVAPGEAVVARSLRCMASIKLNSARIKLHRYCAFFDIPVFSRKHCDLKSLHDADNNPGGGDEPRRWPTCSCSSFANPFTSISATPGSSTTGGGGGASSSIRSPSSDGAGPMQTNFPVAAAAPFSQAQATMVTAQQQQLQHQQQVASFPFSSHQSAKICLKSALNIAHSFDELPFPNPTGVAPHSQQSLAQHPQAGGGLVGVGPGGGAGGSAPCFLSPTSATVCPRTMPSFACCAMQCAYALLMVHQKTKSMYPYSAEVASIAGGAGGGGVPNSNNGHNGGGAIDSNGSGNGAPRPLVVNSLLVRLQQGLTSIYATLSNYSTAFEALGGMRGESGLCGLVCEAYNANCLLHQTKFEVLLRSRKRLRLPCNNNKREIGKRYPRHVGVLAWGWTGLDRIGFGYELGLGPGPGLELVFELVLVVIDLVGGWQQNNQPVRAST